MNTRSAGFRHLPSHKETHVKQLILINDALQHRLYFVIALKQVCSHSMTKHNE